LLITFIEEYLASPPPPPLAPMQYPKETIHTTRLPIEFKRKYKLCMVILDCGNLETFKLALSNLLDFLHKVAIAMGDSKGGGGDAWNHGEEISEFELGESCFIC